MKIVDRWGRGVVLGGIEVLGEVEILGVVDRVEDIREMWYYNR